MSTQTTLHLRTGGLWDNIEGDQVVVGGNKFTVENTLGEGVLTIELLPDGSGIRIRGGCLHEVDGKSHSGILSIMPKDISEIEVRTTVVDF